jgi:trehalose 6-phosphate synthase/phosphatase
MDTFAEPYTRAGDDISLSAVRDHVRALEARHKANGVHLSGRIIHVSHYLPLICTFSSSPTRDGVLSPPPTPPHVPSDVPPSPTEEVPASPTSAPPAPHTPRWKLSPRYGHSAMTSGIRSLSETHEQLIVGWTGDVLSPVLAPDGADGHSNSSSFPISLLICLHR